MHDSVPFQIILWRPYANCLCLPLAFIHSGNPQCGAWRTYYVLLLLLLLLSFAFVPLRYNSSSTMNVFTFSWYSAGHKYVIDRFHLLSSYWYDVRNVLALQFGVFCEIFQFIIRAKWEIGVPFSHCHFRYLNESKFNYDSYRKTIIQANWWSFLHPIVFNVINPWCPIGFVSGMSEKWRIKITKSMHSFTSYLYNLVSSKMQTKFLRRPFREYRLNIGWQQFSYYVKFHRYTWILFDISHTNTFEISTKNWQISMNWHWQPFSSLFVFDTWLI